MCIPSRDTLLVHFYSSYGRPRYLITTYILLPSPPPNLPKIYERLTPCLSSPSHLCHTYTLSQTPTLTTHRPLCPILPSLSLTPQPSSHSQTRPPPILSLMPSKLHLAPFYCTNNAFHAPPPPPGRYCASKMSPGGGGGWREGQGRHVDRVTVSR